MAKQDISLQRPQVVRSNGHIAQRTEPGRYSIDYPALAKPFVDKAPAFYNPLFRLACQADPGPPCGDSRQIFECHPVYAQHDLSHPLSVLSKSRVLELHSGHLLSGRGIVRTTSHKNRAVVTSLAAAKASRNW